MDTMQPVYLMTDDQVLATFGAGDDPPGQGVGAATYTRVLAEELVRARGRLAHYRALYAAFLSAGKPFMVENLDEAQDGAAVPA